MPARSSPGTPGSSSTRSSASRASPRPATRSPSSATKGSSSPGGCSTSGARSGSGSIAGKTSRSTTRSSGPGSPEAASLRSGLLGRTGLGSACRLVFSECDGLSGLTVDRFDRWLVVQFTSLALFDEARVRSSGSSPSWPGAEGILLRGEKGIPSQEGLKVEEGVACGTMPEGPIAIEENGDRLRRRPRHRPEDRLLPRPARQPPGRRRLMPRTGGCSTCSATPAGSRSTPGPRRRGLDPGDRLLGAGDRAGPRERDRQPRQVGPVRGGRRLRDPGAAPLARPEVRPGDLRPAQVRPPSQGPRRRDQGVPAAQPGRRRRAGAGRRARRPAPAPGWSTGTCSTTCSARSPSVPAGRSGSSNSAARPADHPVSASCLEAEYLKCVIARVT